MRTALLGWIALAGAAHAADLTPSELLARIRNQMAQTLAHLPDYTCRETIQRSVQARGSNRFVNQDLLRVDVAFLGGRELYAWPGSPRFGDQSLIDMVPEGAIATGSYGALSKDVFATNSAVFAFDGWRVENGRNQARFRYSVPLDRSLYVIRSNTLADIVPYHGWFTADADTYDVILFEMDANEIPRTLDTLQELQYIEFARSRIGTSEYLLPAASDTLLMDLSGAMSHNHIVFGRCRQYTGESTVTFTEPGVIPEAPPPEPPRPLPRGVQLQLRLTTPIERGVTAIGDVVVGEITKEVRRPVQIPKGAMASLRITRMATVTLKKDQVHAVAFELLNVKTGGRQYDVTAARLQDANGAGPYFVSSGGRIFFRNTSLHIAPGLEMTWRVLQ
jgi:hypothetical protein